MRVYINYLQVNHEESENNLLQFLSSTEYGYALFLTYDQLIVGYVVMTNGFSLKFVGKYQFIDELFVVEKFRRKGIASYAINIAKELAAQQQVCALHLEVDEKKYTCLFAVSKAKLSEHQQSVIKL